MELNIKILIQIW